jgi:hypothetical protein
MYCYYNSNELKKKVVMNKLMLNKSNREDGMHRTSTSEVVGGAVLGEMAHLLTLVAVDARGAIARHVGRASAFVASWPGGRWTIAGVVRLAASEAIRGPRAILGRVAHLAAPVALHVALIRHLPLLLLLKVSP